MTVYSTSLGLNYSKPSKSKLDSWTEGEKQFIKASTEVDRSITELDFMEGERYRVRQLVGGKVVEDIEYETSLQVWQAAKEINEEYNFSFEWNRKQHGNDKTNICVYRTCGHLQVYFEDFKVSEVYSNQYQEPDWIEGAAKKPLQAYVGVVEAFDELMVGKHFKEVDWGLLEGLLALMGKTDSASYIGDLGTPVCKYLIDGVLFRKDLPGLNDLSLFTRCDLSLRRLAIRLKAVGINDVNWLNELNEEVVLMTWAYVNAPEVEDRKRLPGYIKSVSDLKKHLMKQGLSS